MHSFLGSASDMPKSIGNRPTLTMILDLMTVSEKIQVTPELL